MNNLLNDIRFGLRVLIQKPGFTAVAVLTLALGIGANTAIFTLFDAVLLESLPVHDPARLVLFSDDSGEGTRTSDTPPAGFWKYFSSESYAFLHSQPLPFESLAAIRSGEDPVSLRYAGAGGSDAHRIECAEQGAWGAAKVALRGAEGDQDEGGQGPPRQ